MGVTASANIIAVVTMAPILLTGADNGCGVRVQQGAIGRLVVDRYHYRHASHTRRHLALDLCRAPVDDDARRASDRDCRCGDAEVWRRAGDGNETA